ncbi:MAG: hypothetical protein AAGA02_01155 [Bacteroidota bacterium]
MKRQLKRYGLLATLCGLAVISSCGDDDGASPVENASFAVMIETDQTNFSGILAPLDSLGGTVNAGSIASGISMSSSRTTGLSFGRSIYNIFNTSGEVGIAKFELGEDGTLSAGDFIVGDNASRGVVIVSETEGFYSNQALDEKAIQKFNPSVMERTGSIDLSSVIDPILTDEVSSIRVQPSVVVNQRLFVEISFRNEASVSAFDSVFVAIVNTSSEAIEGTAILENEQFSLVSASPNFRSIAVSPEGDVYFGTLGFFGGDFSTYGGHIVRILAGETDFDDAWDVNLDGSGILLTGPAILDGKLYTIQSPEALKPDFSNEFTLFETDIATRQNRMIDGIPNSLPALIAGAGPFIYQDKVYASVKNNDFKGYYSYDPATGETQQVLEIVGGIPRELFILQ